MTSRPIINLMCWDAATEALNRAVIIRMLSARPVSVGGTWLAEPEPLNGTRHPNWASEAQHGNAAAGITDAEITVRLAQLAANCTLGRAPPDFFATLLLMTTLGEVRATENGAGVPS